MATDDSKVIEAGKVIFMVDDGFNDETDAAMALEILGRMHIVTSYYADQGIHAGEVRMRLEGYLTPAEAATLREIMTEARHRG